MGCTRNLNWRQLIVSGAREAYDAGSETPIAISGKSLKSLPVIIEKTQLGGARNETRSG